MCAGRGWGTGVRVCTCHPATPPKSLRLGLLPSLRKLDPTGGITFRAKHVPFLWDRDLIFQG